MLYAVTKLNSMAVMYVRYVLGQCAAVCHYRRLCACARHTHTTDDNDIRPHTIQEHTERTSMEFNLVTA